MARSPRSPAGVAPEAATVPTRAQDPAIADDRFSDPALPDMSAGAHDPLAGPVVIADRPDAAAFDSDHDGVSTTTLGSTTTAPEPYPADRTFDADGLNQPPDAVFGLPPDPLSAEPDPYRDDSQIAPDAVNQAADAALAAALTEAPQPRRRGGGFVPLLLGGLIAGGIGFAAAQLLPVSQTDDPTAQIAALEAQIADLNARTAGLPDQVESMAATIASLPAAPEPGADAAPALAALTERADAALQAIAATDARLAALERRPAATAVPAGAQAAITAAPAASAPDPAQAAALADLRAQVEAQAARLADLTAETGAIAASASALEDRGAVASRDVALRAALLRLEAALEAGGGFASALDEIEAAGITVPDGLRANSDGVPTLLDLERTFAPVARSALDASRKATVGEGALDRVGAFLQTQLGARSLTPQDGDDPDAILSRAEAALLDGALPQALAEIATLPPEGQAALAPWTERAELRLASQAAVDALAGSLKTN